ncbi:MAG: hypothetical protein K2X36_01010 [Microbacteriaceae bacterium]|nr:hypothetical protein [Microbacteriaceae bacterium]
MWRSIYLSGLLGLMIHPLLGVGCDESAYNVRLRDAIVTFGCGEDCTSPQTKEFPVSRTVGSGLSEDFPEGRLIKYDAMVGSGAIDALGCVSVSSANSSNVNVTITVTLNGATWKTFTIPKQSRRQFDLPISPELIRFAVRTSPGSGSSPRPGRNILRATISPTSGICNFCGAAVTLYNFRFNALAPILFVHGRGSSKDWFDKRGFLERFRSSGFGFAFATSPRNSNSIVDAVDLVTSGQDVALAISQTLAEFGADRLHIVAHSKGGLWSRASLGGTFAGRPPVYSLTTLSTPHQGSVLADISFGFSTLGRFSRIISGEFNGAYIAAWKALGADYSLKPSSVAEFNVLQRSQGAQRLPDSTQLSEGRSNRIDYYSYNANANLDASVNVFGYATISALSEACVPTPPDEFCVPLSIVPGTLANDQIPPISSVGASLSFLLQAYSSVRLTQSLIPGLQILMGVPSPNPRPFNDFAVTETSAQHEKFFFQFPIPTHHNGIARASTADRLIRLIQIKLQKRLETGL